METVRQLAGDNAWYQHYPVNDPALQARMLTDIGKAGYEVLIVTVDIPTETRRDRDLRVGLSVPPRINLRSVCDIAVRPAWALATARAGMPEFVNLMPYVPAGLGRAGFGRGGDTDG